VTGRIVVEQVTPLIDGGRYPGKAVVGECLPIRATVWREGHATVSAAVLWRAPGAAETSVPMSLVDAGLDLWQALVMPEEPGAHSFRVEAWTDPWRDWLRGWESKRLDGYPLEDLHNEHELGARLWERVATAAGDHADAVAMCAEAAARLRSGVPPGDEAAWVLEEFPLRDFVTTGPAHHVHVDRPRALFGSWYEVFPRSTGGFDAAGRPVPGTLRTAQADLPRIARMGFDVVYLTPVHPIGEVNRKGRNGEPVAGADDPGCPWAIGSRHGGHDAIAPELGTIADFDSYVETARDLGLEIAMDFALQCAPDHPWIQAHPQWFPVLPDGTIACAENPPRRWRDIHPFDFDTDPEGLFQAILRVLRHWIGHGVRIFRVDNPHTKPAGFWARLIAEVKTVDPDVVFLAEAFTRPALQRGLSKLGFTQSYTYFMWRDTKEELIQFGRELVAQCDFMRPNLWPTTHDVLPVSLQDGTPAMFAIRATLAATLSPSWGVYNGYELCENQPLRPGGQDYLNSEKFQPHARDFTSAPLEPWLTRLNQIRRAHPALQQLRTLRFHDVDNDALLAYSKTDPLTGDMVLCVVTLNPGTVERGVVTLPPGEYLEEFTQERWRCGPAHKIELDPARQVAYLLSRQGEITG